MVFISAFYIVTGLFDWLWCVLWIFNVILLLFVIHLKDFFVIYRLSDDWYYPWNHGRTYELSLDNNYSNHQRTCVLSTLLRLFLFMKNIWLAHVLHFSLLLAWHSLQLMSVSVHRTEIAWPPWENGLQQDCGICSALAMSCTEPSKKESRCWCDAYIEYYTSTWLKSVWYCI